MCMAVESKWPTFNSGLLCAAAASHLNNPSVFALFNMEDIGCNIAGYKVDGKLVDLPFKDLKLLCFLEVEDHLLNHHIVNLQVT